MRAKRRVRNEKKNRSVALLLVGVILLAVASAATRTSFALDVGVPTGPDINILKEENAAPSPATNITTKGGTITTMLMNSTTQNPHWKAYVGNISGKLALSDSRNYTIYDWELTQISGEIYVTRNDSVDWSTIRCANITDVAKEETAMNHTATADDSIRNTFDMANNHTGFWAGPNEIKEDSCNFTTRTYVNSSLKTDSFQEVLLSDGSSLVYTTLINNDAYGFDKSLYDFQLIVAEKGTDGPVSSTTYYFYAELT